MKFLNLAPVVSLLVGATVWGLIWYPYRQLETAGLGGALAATLTYALSLLLMAVLFRRQLRAPDRPWLVVAIGLGAGWANVGFTVAVVHGDVVRVVLLFYLSPIWTALFAWWFLKERLSTAGGMVFLLALAGAAIMLWDPRSGWPLPANGAEWIAISAGVAFAWSNVLSRLAHDVPIAQKMAAVFAGGVVMGLAFVVFSDRGIAMPMAPAYSTLLLLGLLAVVLLSVNFVVQYGLERVPANRAIVIYLFELVVAALSSWLLAGETLTLRDAVGGAMIVWAGVHSGRLAATPVDRRGKG